MKETLRREQKRERGKVRVEEMVMYWNLWACLIL